MNNTIRWLDEYCNAKLISPSYNKLVGALIKEYKINLDRYVSSIVSLVNDKDGHDNYAIDIPAEYVQSSINAGIPFYYITVLVALSKIVGDRMEININSNFERNVVTLLKSNKNGKYLCAFIDEMDDDLDNNGFFVWNNDVNTPEFNSLNKITIQNMCKQTTLRSGLDLLLC